MYRLSCWISISIHRILFICRDRSLQQSLNADCHFHAESFSVISFIFTDVIHVFNVDFPFHSKMFYVQLQFYLNLTVDRKTNETISFY